MSKPMPNLPVALRNDTITERDVKTMLRAARTPAPPTPDGRVVPGRLTRRPRRLKTSTSSVPGPGHETGVAGDNL